VVIAWLNAPAFGADLPPEIVVEVLDESGQPIQVIKVPPLGAVNAPLSLFPSPNGDAALLSWSASMGDGKSPDHVEVVRICVE